MIGIHSILTITLLLVCTILAAPSGKVQYNAKYTSVIGSSRKDNSSWEPSRHKMDPAKQSAVLQNCAAWTNGVCTAHMGKGNTLQVTDTRNTYPTKGAASQANQQHRSAIDAGYLAQQQAAAGPAAPAPAQAPAPAPGGSAPGGSAPGGSASGNP
ncbi:hypothetical protein BDZ85DRAFT_281474 [Elsinoe ampelina]|uniref:Uncharacterized protein n=1 Tax=Elsinoe ampelina TaxID=302913 RepID=A0A6A6GDR4_9PEZI|nr:hypothetical protein BDZ85DRAFT_281474 [Elsinoe ampelina]